MLVLKFNFGLAHSIRDSLLKVRINGQPDAFRLRYYAFIIVLLGLKPPLVVDQVEELVFHEFDDFFLAFALDAQLLLILC